MRLHRYTLAVVALATALAACAEQPRDEEMAEMDSVAGVPNGGAVVMTSSFEKGEGAKRDVGGSVTVLEGTEPGGDYRLSVILEGLDPGDHAWHIHSGPCGKQAPVVVSFTETEDGPGLAQPLSPRADGTAEANVTVPRDRLSLEKLQSGDYSLHVHERGGVDHGPTVACANL